MKKLIKFQKKLLKTMTNILFKKIKVQTKLKLIELEIKIYVYLNYCRNSSAGRAVDL